jgi:exodeoxyribonuclease V gamma subunit
MLLARLGGASWADCRAAEVARGALPPGALAEPLLERMEVAVEALVAAASEDGAPPPASVDVAIDVPGTLGVAGTVAGIRGDVVFNVTYSRMQPSLRLAAWVRLLALTAAWPERPFEALTIGRAEKYSRHLVTVSRMGPLGPDAAGRKRGAVGHLAAVVDLFKRGMREPLPLYCKTSAAYAAARETGADDADDVAKKEWETTQRWRTNEDRDAEHLFVFGELSFKDLVKLSGRADDEGLARCTPPETSRFGLYARLLWGGLLEHETLRSR